MNLIRLLPASLALLALFAGSLQGQGQPVADAELIKLINDYRKENGLEPVPVASELTKVAQTHMQDLVKNKPHEKSKNLNAWSDKGQWTAGVPGEGGKESWTIMWKKPKEIADWEGLGFELNYFGTGQGQNAKTAMDYWKKSQPNREVMLNQGRYKKEWKGIGAIKGNGFYLVWFGQ